MALCVIILSGCGSLHTLPKSDNAIARNLKKHETKCTFLPQVYSGVAYDFCRLNAEYQGPRQRPTYPDAEVNDKIILTHTQLTHGKGFAWVLAADVVLSGVVDTIALPYTIYKQTENGSVALD